MNFSQRSNEKEIMDDGIISQAQWVLFIKDLAWINRYLLNIRSFTDSIKCLCKHKLNQQEPITLAEFACGGGNILNSIALWAKNKALSMHFTGYDINPVFIDYARNEMNKNLPIQFEQQDVLSADFSNKTFDIIICNLFCHHLTNEQLVHFFQQAYSQAQLGLIINDLHRHWLAHLGFNIISFLKQFSPMVRNDGLVSIRRGFVKQEIIVLLNEAGIKNYQIKWYFPFFFNVVIYKKESIL
jgi:2-polyprenyl-3-methyl-5-hydroxy-6-metoxy-1,4-benzoquinol methylase